MGAWSAETFGNDTACDWAYQLEESDDLELIEATLAAVLEGEDEYLDADLACEGLAACEVIARLKGHWGSRNAYTEPADQWVESHPIQPPKALIKTALAVIDRVLSPDSELLELWEEGDASEWRGIVADLRQRVQS